MYIPHTRPQPPHSQVVEPLLITSTYACAYAAPATGAGGAAGGGCGSGGACFVNVQVENRHPSQVSRLCVYVYIYIL